MIDWESFKIALAALAAHRLRAILAMLGVFLGALVLTTVLLVSEAMLLKADLETQRLGPNLVQATAGQVRFGGGSTARVRGLSTTFTLEDAKVLERNVPWVRASAPYTSASRPVRYGSKTTQGQIIGTTPGYPEVRAFYPEFGRFFNQQEVDGKAKVCVLGYDIAARLFGTPENALGKTVLIKTIDLTVIGVMEAKGQDLSGSNQDEQVFLPISTYMRRMNNVDHINGVYLSLYNAEEEPVAMQSMRDIMRQRHRIKPGGNEDFSIFSARDANKLRTDALGLVRTLGFISATVSFAVGSLGILSIMILLVRARRMEIGVRRAVGASGRKIVLQFLSEAGVMAGVGGFLGVIGALLLTTIIYMAGSFPFYYNFWLCTVVFLASIALGVTAGSYPAWVASKVGVLEVLKSPE